MKRFSLIAGICMLAPVVFAQTNTFPSSGNVGIGTISPSAPLDVNGNSIMRGSLSMLNNAIYLTAGGEYVMGTSNSGTLNMLARGPMNLSYNANNIGESLTINNNGNPALVINHLGNTILNGSLAGTYASFSVGNNTSAIEAKNTNGKIIVIPWLTTVNGSYLGAQNNAGSANQDLYLDGTNVKLLAPLTGISAGFTAENIPLYLNSNTGGWSAIAHQYQGATRGFSGYNSGSMMYGGESGTGTFLQSNGQGIIYIPTSGNVGIGTATPTTKLEVNGNITVPSEAMLDTLRDQIFR